MTELNKKLINNFTFPEKIHLDETKPVWDSHNKTAELIDAGAYIRYFDANGKLRVFYNDYVNTDYYGGCMCSYEQVDTMARAYAAGL